MNKEQHWQKLLYEFSHVHRNVGNDKPFKIYENGTLSYGNSELLGTVLILNVVARLTEKLFLHYNENDSNCCVLSFSNNSVIAQECVTKDLLDGNVVFNSNIEDLNRYTTACYFFVNKDLGMGKGKIAAQVSHVTRKMTRDLIQKKYTDSNEYRTWENFGSKTVVCKATKEELDKLKLDEKAYHILDLGRTQIPSGSLTVVGFRPDFLENLPDFSSYKLF